MRYTDFETKKTFVKQMGRLLSIMFPQIAALEYHRHDAADGPEENVIIRHQDGYTLRVDVTGYDLRETHDEVMARLGRRDCDA